MATIDEFALKNIGLWWRYGISRHCDEWKYIIIGRIFESEIILIPPSLKISESSSNGSYRNTDEVWWRYGISRSCDEWVIMLASSRGRSRVGLVHSGYNFIKCTNNLFSSLYGLKPHLALSNNCSPSLKFSVSLSYNVKHRYFFYQ
jgi:hypothetical protein